MKKLQCIFFSIFILSSINLFAQDSTRVDSSKSGLDLIFIGGLGLLPSTAMFGEYFAPTPALTYGIEFPLTKSHNWAFLLHGHFWYAKMNDTTSQNLPFYKISDNQYSQTAISTLFKYYLIDGENKFKISIQLGYMFGLLKDRYEGFDMGLSLYYKIDDKISLSLGYQNITKFHSGGSVSMLPGSNQLIDLFTIEIYYDYRLIFDF